MNTRKLRTLIPVAVLVLAGIGFVAHTGFGNLSALGWESVSLLCPLGALGTMLASKTIVPRAVISLVIAVVGIIILGRAFCAWVCPVPLWEKVRNAFRKQKPEEAAQDAALQAPEAADIDEAEAAAAPPATPQAAGCGHGTCAACGAGCQPSNSRYLVLGGGLLSAAIFGFPVFCLVCPIGLSFALVFVLINLFTAGDVTWSVVAIPVLLALEVTVFRKWCSHICPLSALMSLVGKLNRTLRPTVNTTHCIEDNGRHCGRCSQVCEVGIDPRHPERGANWEECTKCRACVEACPGKAISMPLLPRRGDTPSSPSPGTEVKQAG